MRLLHESGNRVPENAEVRLLLLFSREQYQTNHSTKKVWKSRQKNCNIAATNMLTYIYIWMYSGFLSWEIEVSP